MPRRILRNLPAWFRLQSQPFDFCLAVAPEKLNRDCPGEEVCVRMKISNKADNGNKIASN
jgi:hypothetical protein